MRTQPVRRSAAVLGALALVAAMLGCTASTPSPGDEGEASGTVVVAIPSDLNSLDPAYTLSGEDQELVVNLYDRLVDFKYEERADGAIVWQGLEVAPSLAESWEIDGPTITFHLRDDVSFTSGNKLTAEDVRWSFERLAPLGGNGKNQAGVAGLFNGDQVEVVDEHTVAITFTTPDGVPAELPVSLPNMRFLQFSIIDSATAKEHATSDDPYASKWLAENVAGTGPYTLKSRTPGQEIVLEAVTPRWTGTDPAFSEVVLRVSGSADPVGLLKTGVVEYIGKGVSARQFDDLEASGFTVLNAQVPVIMKAEITADLGPTSDPLVRQAIAYAIPYDQIVESVFSGRAERTDTLLNPQDPSANGAWGYDLDLDKARDLLEKAGVGDFSTKLWYSSDYSALEDTALLIKQSLAEIGITVELQPLPGLQYNTLRTERTQGTNTDMIGISLDGLNGSIWLDDADTVIQNWGITNGNRNWARFSDARVDQLQAEFRSSSDAPARKAAYGEIQDIMAESAAALPVVVAGHTVAVKPGLTGVAFGPDAYMRLLYLKPVE